MNIGFTKKAQNALNSAQRLASAMGHTSVGSEHILLGLLDETEGIAARVLEERGITFDKTMMSVEKCVGVGMPTPLSTSDITPRTKKIIESSGSHAIRLGSGYIGTEHILLAICEESDCYAVRLIAEQGGAAADIKRDIMAYFGNTEHKEAPNPGKKSENDLNECRTLSQFGRNLCQMAKEGKIDPIIGRNDETETVIQILSRRTKNNPCLIGEPGVGKTAVVEGLAARIVEDEVPDTLRAKTIVTLDISSMIAGAKYRGEFEERMKNVMEEVRKNPQIILFIDEIHTIIGAGSAEGAVDAANIIKPALSRSEMQVIGATTIDEYRRHIERDAALERRFQPVTIREPSESESREILRGLRDKYEAHHKLRITDEAIDAAVSLSVRYIGDRFLPDKAIDLIDEAASRRRIMAYTFPPEVRETEERLREISAEKEEAILGENYETAARLRDEEKTLTEKLRNKKESFNRGKLNDSLEICAEDVAEVVTKKTGIPVKRLAEEESERLLHLEEILRSRVIGQDEAVKAVSRAIRRGRMGLKNPQRPIGSFIFLGPTGVGKTELSKVLAEVMFGDKNSMIRIDMSEYMEKHSISKLIGSPPGYVGYDDGGQLTEKIRRRPYSLILFDEIEKAHHDVWSLLLQILEDGILTDSQGRKADFKNTIIIMTSNVGADRMNDIRTLGFASGDAEACDKEDNERIKTSSYDALKQTFKPEFLNRVDECIVFSRLTQENIEKIASIMLDDVKKRIEEIGITAEFPHDVVRLVVKEGYERRLGARPLRRAVVRLVEDSFSEAMLRGEIMKGDRIRARVDGKTVVYEKIDAGETE